MHTEDNLFTLERLIEMVKGRKKEIFVFSGYGESVELR